MSARSTIRRAVFRISLGAVVLMVFLWIASGWFYLRCGNWIVTGGTVSGDWEPGEWIFKPDWPQSGARLHGPYGAGRFEWWILTQLGHPLMTRVVDIPLWMPFLACASVSAFCWRASRKRNDGLCPRCNYDRAGLSQSAPCPECGQPAQKPAN